MREIVLRGKKPNSNNWVYFNPIRCFGSDYKYSDFEFPMKYITESTAKLDSENKKIFEGDLVEIVFLKDCEWCWFYFNKGEKEIAQVIFEDGCFCLNLQKKEVKILLYEFSEEEISMKIIGDVYS